jgi:multicomponent Na+:H+ antiporter subunit E
MRWLILFVGLVGFWAALSLEPAPHLAAAGLVTCGAVAAWIVKRELDLTGWGAVAYLRSALTYTPWLLYQIVLANLRVIRIVWSPKLPIDPCMVEVPCSLKNHISRATYANSITLTPGTVTIDVGPDKLLVHALTAKDAEDLASGDMERRIRPLEGRA